MTVSDEDFAEAIAWLIAAHTEPGGIRRDRPKAPIKIGGE
jgi:hypothetical protein